MTALIFAPLAATVAFLASATPVQSLALQGVLAPRAVSSGVAGSDGEVTLTEFAGTEAKLADWVSATAGPDRSYPGASALAAGRTRPPSGAYAARCVPALWPGAIGGDDQRRARSPALEPWRAPA